MASAGLRLGACARRLRGAAGAARAAGGRGGFPRAVVRGPYPGDSPSPPPPHSSFSLICVAGVGPSGSDRRARRNPCRWNSWWWPAP